MDFLYFFIPFGLLVLLPLALLLKYGDALDRYVLRWRGGKDEQRFRVRERLTRTEHAGGDGGGGSWSDGGGFGGCDGGGG